MEREILHPEALCRPKGYSHGIATTGGKTVWLAGQVAFDRDGRCPCPNDLVAQFDLALRNLREVLAEARLEFTRAIQFDPEFMSAHVYRLVCDLALDDTNAYQRDLEEFRTLFSLDPEHMEALRHSVEVLARLFQGADNPVERIRKIFEQGYEAHTMARYEEAEKHFTEVARLCDREGKGLAKVSMRWYKNAAHYNIACGRALRGDTDGALIAMEEALKGGYNRFDHMRRDSDLDSIRDDDRYKKLIAKYRRRKP